MTGKLRTWCEINLDTLQDNFINIRACVEENTKIMSVIKSDGYGHGCVEVAHKLIECGTDCFAVACADEALMLRKHGICVPILVLGYTPIETIDELLDNDITFTVFDVNFAKELSKKAVAKNITAKIHIKIDVGMGRIGFLYGYTTSDDNCTIEDIVKISSFKGITMEGIFTHFPCADEDDTELTLQQFGTFQKLISVLKNKGITFDIKHCCNSAALIRFPQMHLDMVRPGIILYGCYPSEYCDTGKVKLSPVMELKTKVTNIKTLDAGHRISYGGTYVTDTNTKLATLSIGYADGLYRNLSNRYEIMVNNQKAKIIGRICMDQCMIDVTNVNNITVGQTVTVFGKDNSVEICSQLNGTISYETLCNIGKRVSRVYIENGEFKNVLNLLV